MTGRSDSPLHEGASEPARESGPLVAAEARIRFLSGLLDAADQAIVATDLQGRIRHWNRCAEQLCGWRAEDVLGRLVHEVAPALSAAGEAVDTRGALARGESSHGERLVRRKDGTEVLARVTECPLHEDGRLIGGAAVAVDLTEGHRIEQALRDSEERFRRIFQHAATGIAITDWNGQFLQCNPAYEALTGYSAEELRRLQFDQLIHPDDREQNLDEITRLQAGEVDSFVVENRYVRKSGSAVWVQKFVSVLPDDSAPPGHLLALVSDISDRRRLEEERQAAETFTGRLIDSLFVFVGLLDLDGTLRRANAAPLAAGGLTADQVLDRKFWDCPWWDYSPEVQQRLQDAVASAARGELVRYDVAVRMANDSRMWIDFQLAPLRDDRGVVTHLVPSAIDITDRRRTELALMESEARFRAMADDLPLMVWLHDADGRQEWVNKTFCSFFGVDRAAMRDSRWQMLMHPESAPAYLAEFASCLAEQRAFHAEVQVLGADGDWRWLESFGRPRYDADGAFLGVIGTSIDVTERKLVDAIRQERARAERRAREQAELLAAIMTDLESVDSEDERAQRLADLVVPAFADVAVVRSPGRPAPCVAPRSVDVQQASDLVAAAGASGAGLPDADRDAPVRVLTLALRLGRREHGSLVLARTDPDRAEFTLADASFAQSLADRAGLLLGKARLYEQEHHASLWLQQSLLPDHVVVHPTVSVAAAYSAGTAALEVGGDWYDTIALPDGRIAVTVGDVVGHGLVAAAAMGRLRTAIQALAPFARGPAQLLTDLDHFVHTNEITDFATACYAVVDPATGHLAYSSAGHPPILLVPPAGAPTWLGDARGTPLGLHLAGQRSEAALEIEPGSLLVLYSDGLVERRRRRLSAGMDRLGDYVGQRRHVPLPQLCRNLLADLSAGDAPGEDDMVAVCLRLEPVAATRFHYRLRSEPRNLAVLRRAMRAWLTRQRVAPAHQQRALVLAGEAMSNSIEHAYQARPVEIVTVDMTIDGRELVLTIRDDGPWRPPTARPDRGYGTTLMRGLSESFHREIHRRSHHETHADGTTVTCRLTISPERIP